MKGIRIQVCGKWYVEKDREQAIKFWSRCMRETRGREREAYAKILCGLLNGDTRIEA